MAPIGNSQASQRTLRALAGSVFAAVLLAGIPARAQLPKDFVEKAFAPNATFAEATSITFADDGRIFVGERGGRIKLIQGDKAVQVCSTLTTIEREQGLLKILAHPNFAAKPWLYAYHMSKDYKRHYIVRFKFDANSAVTSLDTVVTLPDLENIGRHNGSGMAFGKDGFLYVGRGNDELGGGNNPAANWASVKGKILRFTEEGKPAPGNPHYATGANDGEKSIWARGFRNPWTLTADPISGRIFEGDVGDGTEELNELTAPDAGKDYWYGYGVGGGDGVGAAGGKAIDPIYFHGTGAKGECAIVGEVPYNSAAKSNWPAEYRNRLYVADYCGLSIRSVPLDKPAAPVNVQNDGNGTLEFYPNSKKKVGLTLGPDGNLYYVEYVNAGKIYQISYTGAAPVNTAPSLAPRTFSMRMGKAGTVEFAISAVTGLGAATDARLSIMEPNGKVRFQGNADVSGGSVLAQGFHPAAAGLHICLLTWSERGEARQAFGRLMVLP